MTKHPGRFLREHKDLHLTKEQFQDSGKERMERNNTKIHGGPNDIPEGILQEKRI